MSYSLYQVERDVYISAELVVCMLISQLKKDTVRLRSMASSQTFQT